MIVCHRTPRSTVATRFRNGYTITTKSSNPDMVEVKTPGGIVYTFRWFQGTWEPPEGCPDHVARLIISLLQEDRPRPAPPASSFIGAGAFAF